MSPKEVMDNLNGLIPGSKYFRWSEALYLSRVQAFALPNDEQIANIITLARALDKVREHYGRPVRVTSWLRPQAYNQLIGGAMKSQHMLGRAVDFVIEGVPSHKVHEELEKRKDIWPYRGEKGITWVHLDLNPGNWFYP